MAKPYVCCVDPFDIQVAIFKSRDEMVKYYKKKDIDIEDDSDIGPCKGMLFHFKDDDGGVWYNLIFPIKCKPKTVVHECSHAIDFIMDDVAVPISVENTEIRAYLLGELFEGVSKALSKRDGKN